MGIIAFVSGASYWAILPAVCIGVGTVAVIWSRQRRGSARQVRLEHAVVVITGASSGLGASLVRRFHAAGARVIALARSVDKMEKLAEELAFGGDWSASTGDSAPGMDENGIHDDQVNKLSGPDHGNEPVKLHPIVCRHLDLNEPVTEKIVANLVGIYDGRIDVLINNAGMSYRGKIDETSMEVHRRLMNVNYFGHIELTIGLLPYLRQSPLAAGVIVGISSIQGRLAIPFRSAYSAAKHAFQAFFDTLRAEEGGAGTGIRVLVLSPSYIRTELSRNALTGAGGAYGRMDATTAKGMPPDELAGRILDAVRRGHSGEMVWMRPGVWLRAALPDAFFWMMERRAGKGEGRPE